MDRRHFMRSGFASAVGITVGAHAFLVLSGTLSSMDDPAHRASRKLARALREIGTRQTVTWARRLEANRTGAKGFSLHLRDAALTPDDAAVIARALRGLTAEEAATLVSLSLSYNAEIRDAGAVAVARALPATLPELGLVGCGLGDRAGTALLHWAEHAPQIRMICVEGNRFSDRMKTRFLELTETNEGLLVVV